MSRVDTALARLRRKELHLRLLDVAGKVGVAESTVSGWETGRYTPSLPDGVAWAQALHMVPEDLVTDEPREAAS